MTDGREYGMQEIQVLQVSAVIRDQRRRKGGDVMSSGDPREETGKGREWVGFGRRKELNGKRLGSGGV